MNSNGKFVISLDFELFWGVRDKRTIDNYGESIKGVWEVMPKMLDLFEEFNVDATFATVGFLFASTKEELIKYSPAKKPQYKNAIVSPYNGHFNLVKNTEEDDKYHFASELIQKIKTYPQHEIATHTYSHYYCQEEGQTIEDFENDLVAAIAIAKSKGIEVQSLVFPRNQLNEDYLKICKKYGVLSVRGNEKAWFYRSSKGVPLIKMSLIKRGFRLLNSYINISGNDCYTIEQISRSQPYNIPSSRFLRPYSSKLSVLEGLRKRRILNSMSYAAKHSKVYHLWWHPHNFGANQEQNLSFLRAIFKHYKKLNSEYNFSSITMANLSEQINKTYG